MPNTTVTLKLYASLAAHLPAGASDNKATIEISDQVSVAEIIAQYQLPERLVHLVLVDGVYIEPEKRSSRILNTGEVLAIWPPVAGG